MRFARTLVLGLMLAVPAAAEIARRYALPAETELAASERLVLERFDARRELANVTAASDAYDPTLVPWWTMDTRPAPERRP